MRSARPSAYTLPELLTCLAILALLVALAVPQFAALRAEWALRTATRALLAGLAEARLAALGGGTEAGLCPSLDGLRCSAGGDRFIVFRGSAARPAVLRRAAVAPAVELTANRPAATYYARPRAASPVTLTLCALPARERARRVVVSQSGRPRVERAGIC